MTATARRFVLRGDGHGRDRGRRRLPGLAFAALLARAGGALPMTPLDAVLDAIVDS